MPNGPLIVFEGAEGAGKSTQIALLLKALSAAGIAAASFREPGGTELGDAVRALLLERQTTMSAAAEAHLFMASRAELCELRIRPALEDRVVVVLDRFFLSTYAYQIVGRGLPEEQVRAANMLATGGLVPDLTLLLEYPVAEGLSRAAARGAHDRIERSSESFHQRVAAAFRSFADPEWAVAHPEAGPVVRMDARGTREAVFERVTEVLSDALPTPFAALRRAGEPGSVRLGS